MINVLFLLTMLILPGKENGHILYINITNYKVASGNIAVALFNDEKSFLSEHKVFRGKVVQITGDGSVTVTFNDLPEGVYAASVFHDKNSNNKLDKNIIGIPREAYGFSNNARGTWGPPHFDDASFTLSAMETSINIALN